jgi:hypothetical protein
VNKKTFIAVCVILVVIVCALFWFFFRARPLVENPPVITGGPCLILQSEDSSRPCFTIPDPARPVPAATSSPLMVPGCAEGTVFEKNDCISKTVQKNGDIGLCSNIQGSIARSACLNQGKDSAVSAVLTPPQNSYEAYVKAYIASSPPSASILSTLSPSEPGTTKGVNGPAPLPAAEMAKVSPQGLYARLANEAALLAFTVFPYQSRPGDTVKIQGTGFALTATNVVRIGGVDVSGLASPDGMNLSVPIPSSASLGTGEVWVTNERGSTRNAQRPIYAVVSNNPAAPPKITGFSPANPKYTDTITLSGDNLNGIRVVSTTLGMIQGTSLSFRVSDLEYANLVLDQESSKGALFPLAVYVQAEGGLSEQPFIINVQF